ncbi:hypothetical protein ACFL3V_06275 [Nanoarchaeota archaeon]
MNPADCTYMVAARKQGTRESYLPVRYRGLKTMAERHFEVVDLSLNKYLMTAEVADEAERILAARGFDTVNISYEPGKHVDLENMITEEIGMPERGVSNKDVQRMLVLLMRKGTADSEE